MHLGWARVTLAVAAILAVPPPVRAADVREDCAPVAASQIVINPQEASPGCLVDGVRDAGVLSAREGRFVAEFTVCEDGAVGRFRLLELGGARVPADVASAVWDAVKGCRWKPGRPRSGNSLGGIGGPAAATLAVSLDAAVGRVTARPPAPDCGARPPAVPVGAPGHVPPRQAVPNCLAHSMRTPARLKGIVTDFHVRLRVGADGCVGEVTAIEHGVESTSGTFQGMAEQAARACQWTPGTDPEGKPVDAMYFTQIHLTGG